MTISNSDRTDGPFVGDGVSQVFAFDFKAFTAGDMLVVLLNAYTGVEAELTLDTDYTVSLNPDQNHYPGGTVNLKNPLATGYTLTITTELDYLQPTDLTNQGGFYPNVITDSLDRLTILTQQLRDCIGRSPMLSMSSIYHNLVMPDPLAGFYIRWRHDLKGFENVGFIESTLIEISAYMANVIRQQTIIDALEALGLDVSLATFSLPDDTYISDYIRTLLSAPDSGFARDILEIPELPTGTIVMWPTEIAPENTMECTGTELLISDYPELFGAIGAMYGGDGITTFRIPYMQGRFVRCWDHGAGNDPDAGNRTDRGDGTTGDYVGTNQADEIASHRHGIYALQGSVTGPEGWYTLTNTLTANSDFTGGNETRPKNINMMCCIKYT